MSYFKPRVFNNQRFTTRWYDLRITISLLKKDYFRPMVIITVCGFNMTCGGIIPVWTGHGWDVSGSEFKAMIYKCSIGWLYPRLQRRHGVLWRYIADFHIFQYKCRPSTFHWIHSPIFSFSRIFVNAVLKTSFKRIQIYRWSISGNIYFPILSAAFQTSILPIYLQN